MTPKRGQPPKPPEDQRKNRPTLRYSDSEMSLLKEAYELSGAEVPFLRWLANVTLEEAERIISDKK